MAAATELTLTGTELARSLDLADIGIGTNGLEKTHSSGSARDSSTGEYLGVDDQRNLWDGGNLVATGEEESWDRGSSQGRGGSETPEGVSIKWIIQRCYAGVLLLAQVDLLVPLTPDLCWGEHATRAAHVTEGSLTSAVSSTTGDTRNTCNGASCDDECQRLILSAFLSHALKAAIVTIMACEQTSPV